MHTDRQQVLTRCIKNSHDFPLCMFVPPDANELLGENGLSCCSLPRPREHKELQVVVVLWGKVILDWHVSSLHSHDSNFSLAWSPKN